MMRGGGSPGSGTPADEDPFGARRASPRGRLAKGVGLILVVAAAVVAAAVAGRSPAAPAEAAHGHDTATAAGTRQPVALEAEAAQRIGVTFAPVLREPLQTEIRTVALVAYDETRVKEVVPKFDGWVERLFVNYTGQHVQVGDSLFTVYAPMVVTAQEELLAALRLTRQVAHGDPDAVASSRALLDAARRRLLYWDVPPAEVTRLETTGEVQKTVVLHSPIKGVVVSKPVLAGGRLVAGEPAYRIADLSVVWLEGEVFEQDAADVATGQQVTAEFRALPGVVVNGRISYVSPVVEAATRTVRIRVELRNPDFVLKPGMYATLRAPGRRRGVALVIPRSAVLVTGKRTVAFVRSGPLLEPRDIVTGIATDERIEVLQGLAVGDTVVASATFLVDAESNLGSALGGMGNMPGMGGITGGDRDAAMPGHEGAQGIQPPPDRPPSR